MAGNELYVGTGILLIFIGFVGVLTRRNLLKMVIGFSIIDTGVNLLIVALGYLPGRTAPIVNSPKYLADASSLTVDASKLVDPVPQALVLTAIVIGVGVTALMLSYVIRLYATEKTLDVRQFGRLKW
ncbi:MAG: cation:proton antiporter [Acidobacteria bacterium]|nr:cation:proton antiporter [Acidobacteriota bacterium]